MIVLCGGRCIVMSGAFLVIWVLDCGWWEGGGIGHGSEEGKPVLVLAVKCECVVWAH